MSWVGEKRAGRNYVPSRCSFLELAASFLPAFRACEMELLGFSDVDLSILPERRRNIWGCQIALRGGEEGPVSWKPSWVIAPFHANLPRGEMNSWHATKCAHGRNNTKCGGSWVAENETATENECCSTQFSFHAIVGGGKLRAYFFLPFNNWSVLSAPVIKCNKKTFGSELSLLFPLSFQYFLPVRSIRSG